MAGKDAKGYVNTGSYGSKTWSELRRATEFEFPRTRGSSQFLMRGYEGEVTAIGYKKRAVTFKYHMKKAGRTDAVFNALNTAYENGTPIECAFVDRPIATVGATGISGFFEVVNFNRTEPDEDSISVDVELRPADHEEAGTVVEVAPYTTPS